MKVKMKMKMKRTMMLLLLNDDGDDDDEGGGGAAAADDDDDEMMMPLLLLLLLLLMIMMNVLMQPEFCFFLFCSLSVPPIERLKSDKSCEPLGDPAPSFRENQVDGKEK